MGKFEIEVTLLSFIWAIALTHILQGLRDLWIARDRVKPSASHLLWMAALLTGTIFSWLPLASANGRLADWMFAVLVTYAIALYFAAAFVSPRVPETGVLDLSAYETRDGHAYKLSFVVMMLAAYLLNIGFYHRSTGTYPGLGALLPGVPAVIALLSMWRRERWIRLTCGVLVLGVALALLVLNIVVN